MVRKLIEAALLAAVMSGTILLIHALIDEDSRLRIAIAEWREAWAERQSFADSVRRTIANLPGRETA